ncbi:myo-inositol-1-monophosphatase [Devosia sp. 17-2-E-8]|nr:myo-inositol-1-monophosphatase [Devosia sp. 17-2-E-8]
MTTDRLGLEASSQLAEMARIAMAAGDIARNSLRRYSAGEMVHKKPRDFQTEADVAVEAFIVGELRKAFPDHGIWGEEQVGNTEQPAGAPRFLIDPIDGTTNFAWGIPHFGIVISREIGGVIDKGVVYDCMQDELFSAEQGQGAYLNGRAIRATTNADPINAVVGAGLPVPGQVKSVPVETYHHALRRLMDTTSGVRRLGSAAMSLAYVACGRLDGFFEDGLSPLDYGASVLIVREAGGVVTGFNGAPIPESGAILAGGAAIHPWLVEGFRY